MSYDAHVAKPVQILLVEDNPDEALLTREALKDAKGANVVHVAEDGVEALQFVRREAEFADAPRPDLILLDLNLPRKDGRQVLTEIKHDNALRGIPVIVLSTSSSEKDLVAAYESGANAYIRKPVNLGRFIGVVTAIDHFWLGVAELPLAKN